MKILSSLEIKAEVSEIQKFIDGKIDQVYQPDNTEVVLTIHKTGVGRHHLRLVPGVTLYVSKRKRQSPPIIINFCRFLRKRIGNAKIRKIVQKDFERIVEFHFETKEQNFILICEFFSKGNVILCDENYVIISALQVQLWKDRKIKAREVYQYPPSRQIKFDTFEEFLKYMEASDRENIVKKLATLNLGGLYAEEVCARARVNKTSVEVDDKTLLRIFNELNRLLEGEDYKPRLVDHNPVPFAMKSFGIGKEFETYSEALEEYYSPFIEDLEVLEEKALEGKVDKAKSILDDQLEHLEQVKKDLVEGRVKGDWIYEHYIELQEILQLFKEKKYKELEEKGLKIRDGELILEI